MAMAGAVEYEVAHGKLLGRRETYEDRSLAMKILSNRSEWGFRAVIAVADGMGGHNAGDVAAQTAIDAIREITGSQREMGAETGAIGDEDAGRDALARSIRVANSRIYGRAAEAEALTQMGTTATVAALEQERVVIAHVGDSRAYSIRHDGIRQLTEDHSWVAEQVRAGAMSADEARRSPMRNQIVRSVGTHEDVESDLVEVPLQGDEIILLCSDGLVECLGDEDLFETVRSADSVEAAVQGLLDAAQAVEPQDNVTVAAMEIGDFFHRCAGATGHRAQETPASRDRGAAGGRSRATVLALVVLAAFSLAVVARLGWAAFFAGGEERAVHEHVSVADGVREPPETALARPEAPAETASIAVHLDAEARTLTLRLSDDAARFETLTPHGDRDAWLVGDREIAYRFQSAASIPPLADGRAGLLFGASPDGEDTVRWDAESGLPEVRWGEELTCWYVGEDDALVALFDFTVVRPNETAD